VEFIEEFPRATLPFPPNVFVIGPKKFDSQTLISYISTAHPDDFIIVHVPLRSGTYPYQVPVKFFYAHFPPSTASIMEIERTRKEKKEEEDNWVIGGFR